MFEMDVTHSSNLIEENVNRSPNDNHRQQSSDQFHEQNSLDPISREEQTLDDEAANFLRWWLSLSMESLSEDDFLIDKRVICYESDSDDY